MRRLKRLITSLACLTLLMGLGVDPPPGEAPPQPQDPSEVREVIKIGEETFRLEVAADPESRQKGLMGRKKVEVAGGMLFVFPDDRIHSFWMANCLVDIDLAFIDRQGRIVRLHKMKAEPPRREGESEGMYEARLKRYSSVRPARFAIELRAGSIDRLELEAGRRLELDVDRLARLARE
jgi:hypothetical protein